MQFFNLLVLKNSLTYSREQTQAHAPGFSPELQGLSSAFIPSSFPKIMTFQSRCGDYSPRCSTASTVSILNILERGGRWQGEPQTRRTKHSPGRICVWFLERMAIREIKYVGMGLQVPPVLIYQRFVKTKTERFKNKRMGRIGCRMFRFFSIWAGSDLKQHRQENQKQN